MSETEQNGAFPLAGDETVPYRFRIKCFSPPSDVKGADAWAYDEQGQVLVVDKHGSSFTLSIQGLQAYSGNR